MNALVKRDHPKPDSKLIFVDSNAVSHYIKHGLKRQLSKLDLRTGVIFGFLMQVRSLAKRFETNRFAFFWDTQYSKRKEVYSSYKANRGIYKYYTDEDLDLAAQQQMTELRNNVLPSMGFSNVFEAMGYEADDLIASSLLAVPNEEVVIVSTDSDLFQLLNDNCFMWDFRKKIKFTKDDFEKEYGISPDKWPTVKAIAGDSSDNIKGVPRIGKILALQYVKGKFGSKSSHAERIMLNLDIVERNKILVTLPYNGCPTYQINTDYLWIKDFLTVCDKYGFHSFTRSAALDEWISVMQMN